MTEAVEKDPLKMTEPEFVEHALNDMLGGWVPLAVYQRMFPEETTNAIHIRVKRGIWQRRVHYIAPSGSSPWVNLKAIRAWLEASAEAPREE
jgi:hypothetical protein